MTQEEKMKALRRFLIEECTFSECKVCEFSDSEDATDDEYFCGIRDGEGKIPYHDKWNFNVALGLEKPYKPVFPEEVENKIMQHFVRGE